MRHSFLLLLPLLALASCVDTLEESASDLSSREISFQVVKHPTSRTPDINGVNFTYDHFVTHAWSEASVNDDKVFMNHQRVELTNGKWAPTSVYYWPTYSSVDFISYYPQNEGNTCPVVGRETLTYTNYDVSGEKADITTATNDLMYADKAVGYGANEDRVSDDLEDGADSGYTGVPTLFNHALAQLEIRVLVMHPEGETESHWEAEIDKASLGGYYTNGSLTLSLENPSLTHGVTGWQATTEGVDNQMVGWKNDEVVKNLEIISADATDKFVVSSTGTGEGYVAEETRGGCRTLYEAFVLPQSLGDGHSLELALTLSKYRGANKETSERNLESSRVLKLKTAEIPDWCMNQRIVYTIVINPAKNGIITCDPAVASWKDVNIDMPRPRSYFSIPSEGDWEQSNVWYAMDGDTKVAEIAKEAVYTPVPKREGREYYQVVTVYPVIDGKTQLDRGFIAQVLKDADGANLKGSNLAGGSVEMNSRTESEVAIKSLVLGNQANGSHVFIDKEGNISFGSVSALDKKIEPEAYTVTDVDHNVYPVVKVGALYWLRENLRVTKYNDGTTLIAEYNGTKDPEIKEPDCVYFPDGMPKYAWYDNGKGFNVKNQSEDVKKRYGLLYNFRAICGDDDPWITPVGGDFALLDQAEDPTVTQDDGAPNKSIAPTGWHIPSANITGAFGFVGAEMEYMYQFTPGWNLSSFLNDNMAANGADRDLSTAQWPYCSDGITNLTGLSYNAVPALGQSDEDAFFNKDGIWVLSDGKMKGGLFLTWTTALLKTGSYWYQGMMTAACFTGTYFEGTENTSYPEFSSEQYIPLRCVRNY